MPTEACNKCTNVMTKKNMKKSLVTGVIPCDSLVPYSISFRTAKDTPNARPPLASLSATSSSPLRAALIANTTSHELVSRITV